MIKRLFDIVNSLLGIILLAPLFILIGILIAITSKGGVFYKQIRVGRNNVDFTIFKFRTMFIESDKKGLLTVGEKDARVTKIGYYLRKYKLDELPQLFNVFIGNMSFVGPRPEVRKYVNFYNSEQFKVLSVKPGITDLASIEFRNENEILLKSNNPEQYYIDIILPKKIDLNMKYLKNRSLITDIEVIFKTFRILS